jgi:PGF-CTERM protein
MYDVNFGGIERMTKRFTIALVALALFILAAVMPVSAAVVNGGTAVWIGETGLNLSAQFAAANTTAKLPVMGTNAFGTPIGPVTVSWFGQENISQTPAPVIASKTIADVSNMAIGTDYTLYPGTWSLVNATNATAVFNVVGTPTVPISNYNGIFYTVAVNILQGGTVYVGEQGLNILPAVISANSANTGKPFSTKVGWWASAAVVTTTAPTKQIDMATRAGPGLLTVSPADFVGYTGNWYLLNTDGTVATAAGLPIVVFAAADPSLDIRIWDVNQGTDVTGASVPQGELISFRVDTNLYQALTPTGRFPVQNNPKTDGYIDFKVKDESGAIRNKLLDANTPAIANSITGQNVTTSGWFWGSDPAAANVPGLINWSTGALDTNGQPAYPTGTYTIWAESLLNNMKANYKNAGADYTGKTVSQTYTLNLVSDTVKIEANKDSVVRSKPFSVTVTGKPSTVYHVWVKGTSTLGTGYDNQAPMITPNQAGVQFDSPLSAFTAYRAPTDAAVSGVNAGLLTAGGYVFQNSGAGRRIIDDVPTNLLNGETFNATVGVQHEANVTLSTSGTRTVEFTTTNWTKAQKYTIRVEQIFAGQIKSDEVDVNVEKGAVTIVAAGDQSYYLGEEIKFSGTNTETSKTYLFIIGPNLDQNGAQIDNQDPRHNPVRDNDVTTFKVADVLGDNTWSWKWGTANYALDAGTYTIYAVSGPRNKAQGSLAQVAYGTVSIIIKKPFVSATASQSTVAQGDNVFITGTAEGNPSPGVQVWILGKNFYSVTTEAVNSDASFSHEIKKETTASLYPGQYFVVVQHPMQNNIFDVRTAGPVNSEYVINAQLNQQGTTTPTKIFQLGGAGSLQGSDAAEALVEGINDANVDDTYTKLQFLVETPVIRIDPIGDKHVGDKFTITASTNLAVDDEILVEVYSSSFKPTQKSQSGEFSGATGTVKVTKGDSGLNKISFDIDSSTFKPDEYLVTEKAVLQDATGTALFNVLDTVVTPVTTVTPFVTTVVPTQATPIQTTVVPTAIPTTKSPGYGALIALIGLGAVAFIVVRRH